MPYKIDPHSLVVIVINMIGMKTFEKLIQLRLYPFQGIYLHFTIRISKIFENLVDCLSFISNIFKIQFLFATIWESNIYEFYL